MRSLSEVSSQVWESRFKFWLWQARGAPYSAETGEKTSIFSDRFTITGRHHTSVVLCICSCVKSYSKEFQFSSPRIMFSLLKSVILRYTAREYGIYWIQRIKVTWRWIYLVFICKRLTNIFNKTVLCDATSVYNYIIIMQVYSLTNSQF